MKNIFMLLCFLATFLSLDAQNLTIDTSKSKVFKDEKKHTELLFTEKDGNGGFVTVRAYLAGFTRSIKGYYIEHYNADMKMVKKKEIEINKSKINGLSLKNGTISLVKTSLDRKRDQFVCTLLEAPLESMEFTEKELFSLDKEKVKRFFGAQIGFFVIGRSFEQMDSDILGEVTYSSNKNYFCVNFDLKDRNSQTQLLYVFNEQGEKVYSKEFSRDIEDRLFVYENIDVSDTDGTIFLLGKVYENGTKKSKKKGKANYHYELFKIDASGEQKTSFKTSEKFVGSLFVVTGEETLSCAGFYSDKKDHRYKGVCRFNIDPSTMEVTTKKFSPFSEEFILDKYGKKKDKELSSLTSRGVYATSNDAIIINAEEFYVTYQTTTNANGNMNSRTILHYNDIVSVKIGKDGDLIWSRNINKKQATQGANTEYLSFSSTSKDNNTYLFINCSDKVRKLKNDRIEFKQTKAKKANLYAIQIDPDGNFEYQKIVDDKDSEVPFFVSQGIPTSNDGDEMVFIGRRKSKKQFLKLRIN